MRKLVMLADRFLALTLDVAIAWVSDKLVNVDPASKRITYHWEKKHVRN